MRSQSETESVVACQQVVAELALLLDHEGLSQTFAEQMNPQKWQR